MLRVMLLEHMYEATNANHFTSEFVNKSLKSSSFHNIHIDGSWITTSGRFNQLYTYALEDKHQSEKNVFKLIREHNRIITDWLNETRHIYPIYLLDPNEDDDKTFWNISQFSYIAIIRINFVDSFNITNNFKLLQDELTQNDDICFNYEFIEEKTYDSIGRLYRTTELSDAVLVLRGKNYSDIISKTMFLQNNNLIGNTYTYFGIDCEKIKKRKKTNEKLPFYSLQFSMPNSQKANDIKDYLRNFFDNKEKFYFVSGIDDLALICHDVDVDNLLNFYNALFFSQEKCDFQCLYNATTKIGCETENFIHNIKSKKTDDEIISVCQRLNQQFLDIKKKNTDWSQPINDLFKSLSELIGTLQKMCKTPILDEFVYLMVDGVRAFLHNFSSIVSNNMLKSLPHIEKCQLFVNSWTHLTEYVTRIEGELTHYPEMRPIVYDIPLMMLEFTLSFLINCVKNLQGEDKNNQTCFLLVPQLCERIEAVELFSCLPENSIGLIVINIPFHILYNPKEMFMSLCHETAHFSGQKIRRRDIRTKNYAKTVAVLVEKYMFKFDSDDIFDFVYKDIKETISSNDTMNRIREKAISKVESWFSSNARYSNFIRDILNKKFSEGSCEEFVIPVFNELIISQISYSFGPILKNISDFYRETFADICMIYMLNLSEKEYINHFVPEYREDVSKEWDSYAVRPYVCLLVCDLLSESRPQYHNMSDSFNSILDKVYAVKNNVEEANFKKSEESVINGFPTDVINLLSDYLKKCKENVKKLGDDGKLRKAYNIVYGSDSYDMLQDYISEYRQYVVELFNT